LPAASTNPSAILAHLNDIYFVGTSNQEVGIYRINGDGTASFIPDKDFRLLLANKFVRTGKDGTKLLPADKFWLTQPARREFDMVFKPDSTTNPNEFNLWRGFAVMPKKGWANQRRLLRHIRQVICRRDRKKFKYLMRWLAWSAQHPDEAPGTLIVLVSATQGTGKSTLGVVMCDIFGHHGRRIDDQAQLLGHFNGDLETACMILADEMLFAGDPKTADKLKSRVTSDTIPLEAKFRNRREVPNRMHVIMTTNHEHAVSAGVRDRRFFVCNVSDEHAQDPAWFRPLYRDLDHGGKAQFLWLLQNIKLGDWHPRNLIKTEEAIEQQRMSADSIGQWSQACIEAEGIVGGAYGGVDDLGRDISSEQLRQAYTTYCKQHGLRAVNADAFGKALAGMFGERRRLPQRTHNRRPWGYTVPDGDQWQKKLNTRLGI
jgi:hypothetical protein